MHTPRLNLVMLVAYLLATVGLLGAALFLPSIRAAAPAPLRDLILPPPRPVELSLLYSTEKAEWIDEAVRRFEESRITASGRPIHVQLSASGSREMYLTVLDGQVQPDIISPASMLQISLLQDLSASKSGTSLVNPADTSLCRSVLRSPVVVVAWKERADVLWGETFTGMDMWLRMQEALTDPRGWQAYGHPEWGFVKFGHTNPLKSNSGFQTILLMTYSYLNKTQGLTSQDILANESYQAWFTDFEGAIPKFGDSTGTYMNEIIAYGPSMYDFVTVYEATAISQIDNAAGRYGELHIYYPPTTSLSDHPFCTLQAEWVTPEKAEAARLFLDFLTSQEMQELALLKYGFRPVHPGVALDQPGSPFVRYAGNGVRLMIPAEVEVPQGSVLNTLLEFWARNVQR